MKSKRPPATATWILQQFGCGPDKEAVLGDLAERYRKGSSRTWYWSQIIVATVVSIFSDLRRHKLLALRALIVGWFAFSIPGELIARSVVKFSESWPPNWLYYPLKYSTVGSRLPEVWWQWDRFQAIYWLSITGMIVAAMCLSGILSGWIVGRLHRRQRSMVLLHAASISLSWIIQGIIHGTENIGPLPYRSMNMVVVAICILIGGLPMTNQKHSFESTAGDPTEYRSNHQD